MPTFRQVLKKAIAIALTNPALWFFGIFIGLMGVTGEIGILARSINLGQDQSVISGFIEGIADSQVMTSSGLLNSFQLMVQKPLAFLLILVIYTLIIFIFFGAIWFVVVSQATVIDGAVKIIKNKKWDWADSFRKATKNFWPLFLLDATLMFISAGYFSTLMFLGSRRLAGGSLFFDLSYIFGIAAMILIAFVFKYAIMFIVLQGQSLLKSFRLAWQTFTRNWLVSLEFALIIFIINWLIIQTLFLVLGYLELNYVFSFPINQRRIQIFYTLTFIISLIVQAVLAIFYWASWAIIFEILTNGRLVLVSRLHYILNKAFGKKSPKPEL